MPNFSRRQLLLAGSALGLGSFIYKQGLRYPRMGFEPDNPPSKVRSSLMQLELVDCVYTGKDRPIALRAIAPEPKIKLQIRRAGVIELELNNLANNAELHIDGKGIKNIDEQILGISRRISITTTHNTQIELSWALPNRDAYKFAIIGDTGGKSELEWCLARAHSLDAQFLLHLGDFNYTQKNVPTHRRSDEYELAIRTFKQALLPVYISIGNHDFNQDGLVYQRFINELGPMNHAFELGGARFINVDTAADFFPAASGNRGAFLRSLSRSDNYDDQLIFTHKPIQDPRENDDHAIGSASEINWLRQQMSEIGCSNLFNGHVHHSDERDLDGIQQWTVGEGLGHEDIVHKRRVSKFLVGNVERGRKIDYAWHALNMPWAAHLSHTHETKLLKYKRLEQLKWYKELLQRDSVSV